jgi:hypothetical protein
MGEDLADGRVEAVFEAPLRESDAGMDQTRPTARRYTGLRLVDERPRGEQGFEFL